MLWLCYNTIMWNLACCSTQCQVGLCVKIQYGHVIKNLEIFLRCKCYNRSPCWRRQHRSPFWLCGSWKVTGIKSYSFWGEAQFLQPNYERVDVCFIISCSLVGLSHVSVLGILPIDFWAWHLPPVLSSSMVNEIPIFTAGFVSIVLDTWNPFLL